MILDTLAAASRQRAEELLRQRSLASLRSDAEALPQTNRGFAKALQKPGVSFICEVKKASPSKGLIAPDFNPTAQARLYEEAGAAAISCLTEPQYFLGSNAYLTQITQAVSLPVLRKDFTVSPAQIYEAKLIGADAVLLICALLDAGELREYLAIAQSVGLDVLTEAHDEKELEQALAAGAEIIGVNNRDLRDFTVDLNNSLRLKKLAPPDKIFVSESGIKTAQDVAALKAQGVDAVLIGETLMKSGDVKAKLRELAGE